MSEIKLAFVGAGMMGQGAHLRNYASLPGCRVVALAEKRPRLGQEVARRYGIERVYSDYPEMLAKEEVDGIVAIQPFERHIHYVPDLLQAGLPLLTEKPLAATLADGETIFQATKSASAPYYLGYHKRSDPATAYAMQTMRAWDATREVGGLRYVRITMPPGDWAVQAFANNIGTDEKLEDGFTPAPWDAYGGFVNYYIHQVNLMRYLLGGDYEVLYADPKGITMTVQSTNAVIGVFEMNPFTTTLDWQESALVAYERGWIRLELPAPMVIDQPGRVTVFSEGAIGPFTVTPVLKPWHAMRQQAANFLSAIRGEEHPLCGAEDALKDLQVAQQYIQKHEEAKR